MDYKKKKNIMCLSINEYLNIKQTIIVIYKSVKLG